MSTYHFETRIVTARNPHERKRFKPWSWTARTSGWSTYPTGWGRTKRQAIRRLKAHLDR